MTMAEVFLTEEEALKLMFPNQHGSERSTGTFHRTRRQSSRVVLIELSGESFEVYIGETGTHIDGMRWSKTPSANTNP